MCYRMFRTQICVTSIARTVQGTQFQNISYTKSDVWLTVHRNSVWIRKTN